MKKRKGKQAEGEVQEEAPAEAAQLDESADASVVDSELHAAAEPAVADDAADEPTLPHAAVASRDAAGDEQGGETGDIRLQDEVGDDDVTNRLDVSALAGAGITAAAEEDAAPGEAVEGEAVEGEAAEVEVLPGVDGSKLESILESLLFATDRPLALVEFKRLLGERDGKRISEALEGLRQRRADSGIQLASVAGAWQLRTHPENGAWVAKLVAGRPPRLSRAMMETLSIVAYRQPITRPELDEIRGVDCGPVLRTLLDRGLIRIIGKKEEVGRPMLYGTTPEFLKIFSLRDLTELPTLREFHELGADDRAKVDAQGFDAGAPPGDVPPAMDLPQRPPAGELPDVDPEEEDSLLDALDRATQAAGHATRSATEPEPPTDGDSAAASTSSEAGER